MITIINSKGQTKGDLKNTIGQNVMNISNDMTYQFDLPLQHQPIIKVIGVGGGGSNAVNNMYQCGIQGVSFIVCNTDAQALQVSPIQNKLQIGAALTGGLGAGANPEVGRNAALESKESIRELLCDHTKMLFITAGMGGGTGTGAAPVIASIAHKLGILTVGIVTLPFSFEGMKKRVQAQEGIDELRKYCDTVLIILNDRLQTMLGGFSISRAFQEADNVLTTAAKSIAEIITVPGYVNVDFEDVKTVMKNAGAAVMGSGEAEGEERALQAAELALSSPLLDYTEIRGAKKILLSIVSGPESELQMDELTIITNYIQKQTGNDAEMIFGHGADPQIAKKIKVTVIATGFCQEQFNHKSLGQAEEVEGARSTDGIIKSLNKGELYRSHKVVSGSSGVKPVLLDEVEKGHKRPDKHPFQLPLPFRNYQSNDIKVRNWDDRYFREQLEIPTYMRKQIQLDVISSDEKVLKELVRYQLDDV